MIDLICPTIPGREASLERCLDSFSRLTGPELNPIVVRDSKTCGWGWQKGLERSSAPYVLLACDDQEVISDEWAEVAMETVDQGLLPAPRVWFPDGRVESMGGDMKALAHLSKRPKRDLSPTDYTTIPFLSREQIDAIGMLDGQYAGDVWVSYRGRQLGYETVLRHGYDFVHHYESVGRGAGMPQAQRDAMDVEAMQKELAKCASS